MDVRVRVAVMADLAGWVVFLAAVLLVLVALRALAVRARRRGLGDVMGPFDEIWHPSAHLARQEIHRAIERPAPPPSPGDQGGAVPDGAEDGPAR